MSPVGIETSQQSNDEHYVGEVACSNAELILDDLVHIGSQCYVEHYQADPGNLLQLSKVAEVVHDVVDHRNPSFYYYHVEHRINIEHINHTPLTLSYLAKS